MTLQTTGPISMGDVRRELGLSGTTSLNLTSVRTLLGKPSGTISLREAYGKSATSTVTPVYVSLTPSKTNTNEGETIFFTLTTQNVPNGTVLNYINSQGSISDNDIILETSKTITVNNNSASFAVIITEDNLTESPVETFKMGVYKTIGTWLIESPTITIADTSQTGATYSKPTAPTLVQAVGGDTVATVTWSRPISNGGYTTEPTYTVTTIPATVSKNNVTSPLTFNNLTNGNSYIFVIIASNLSGDSPEARSSNTLISSSITLPSEPINIIATAGIKLINLTWQQPTNTGGVGIPIRSYDVLSDKGIPYNNSSSPLEIPNLIPGTEYTFSVRARNDKGLGNAGNSNKATPNDVASTVYTCNVAISGSSTITEGSSIRINITTTNVGTNTLNYRLSGDLSFLVTATTGTVNVSGDTGFLDIETKSDTTTTGNKSITVTIDAPSGKSWSTTSVSSTSFTITYTSDGSTVQPTYTITGDNTMGYGETLVLTINTADYNLSTVAYEITGTGVPNELFTNATGSIALSTLSSTDKTGTLSVRTNSGITNAVDKKLTVSLKYNVGTGWGSGSSGPFNINIPSNQVATYGYIISGGPLSVAENTSNVSYNVAFTGFTTPATLTWRMMYAGQPDTTFSGVYVASNTGTVTTGTNAKITITVNTLMQSTAPAPFIFIIEPAPGATWQWTTKITPTVQITKSAQPTYTITVPNNVENNGVINYTVSITNIKPTTIYTQIYYGTSVSNRLHYSLTGTSVTTNASINLTTGAGNATSSGNYIWINVYSDSLGTVLECESTPIAINYNNVSSKAYTITGTNSINEGNVGNYTITCTGFTTSTNVTLTFSGSATYDTDYTASVTQVTLNSSNGYSANFTINALSDTITNENETFTIGAISSGVTWATETKKQVTIVDTTSANTPSYAVSVNSTSVAIGTPITGNLTVANGTSGTYYVYVVAGSTPVLSSALSSTGGNFSISTSSLIVGASYNIRVSVNIYTTGQVHIGPLISITSSSVTDDYGSTYNSTNPPPGNLTVNGAELSGSLETSADVDFFKVNLTSGTAYIITATWVSNTVSGDTLDIVLNLFNDAGVFIQSIDNHGGGADETVTYTPVTSGVHYISIADYAGSGNLVPGTSKGAYKIKITSVGSSGYNPVFGVNLNATAAIVVRNTPMIVSVSGAQPGKQYICKCGNSITDFTVIMEPSMDGVINVGSDGNGSFTKPFNPTINVNATEFTYRIYESTNLSTTVDYVSFTSDVISQGTITSSNMNPAQGTNITLTITGGVAGTAYMYQVYMQNGTLPTAGFNFDYPTDFNLSPVAGYTTNGATVTANSSGMAKLLMNILANNDVAAESFQVGFYKATGGLASSPLGLTGLITVPGTNAAVLQGTIKAYNSSNQEYYVFNETSANVITVKIAGAAASTTYSASAFGGTIDINDFVQWGTLGQTDSLGNAEFTITMKADMITEGDQTFYVGYFIPGTDVSGTLWQDTSKVIKTQLITINDTSTTPVSTTPTITVSTDGGASYTSGTISVDENTDILIKVTGANGAQYAISTYNITGNTTWGSTGDYTISPTSLAAISGGQSTITMHINADATTDGNKTFAIGYGAGTAAPSVIGGCISYITVNVNDTSTTPVSITPTITSDNYSPNEGSTIIFTITGKANTQYRIWLYKQTDGSAIALDTTGGANSANSLVMNQDFSVDQYVPNITSNNGAGGGTTSYVLHITADLLTEGNESFYACIHETTTTPTSRFSTDIKATTPQYITVNDTSTSAVITPSITCSPNPTTPGNSITFTCRGTPLTQYGIQLYSDGVPITSSTTFNFNDLTVPGTMSAMNVNGDASYTINILNHPYTAPDNGHTKWVVAVLYLVSQGVPAYSTSLPQVMVTINNYTPETINKSVTITQTLGGSTLTVNDAMLARASFTFTATGYPAGTNLIWNFANDATGGFDYAADLHYVTNTSSNTTGTLDFWAEGGTTNASHGYKTFRVIVVDAGTLLTVSNNSITMAINAF